MSDKKLNPDQKNAVEFKKGPLLIIAGAGTGKTTVVTERIKHLIINENISPDRILALTFTEKAAFEMQERVDILLPYGYTHMWINTFHAFCDRALRDEAHQIGLDPNFKQISEAEAVLFLQQNIFELGLKIFKPQSNPVKFLDALLVHFSRLKDEDITPDEYRRYSRKLETRNPKSETSAEESAQYVELANAYKKYEELKVKNSLMDFSDLISNTLLLFRKRPDVLKRYQKKFQFILVDEFQDTNYSQNELAILLAGDDKNITVVADDDQSIYRFRGAAVSNVLQFKKNLPKASIMTLTRNYRSTQTILDASYTLIQNNNPNRLEVVESINKKLKSNFSGREPEIEFLHEVKAEDEADEIARTIKKITKKEYKYNDIAILVRANNHAQAISQALVRHSIPFQFLGPSYLFNQDEVKDLIAYLRFLTNPSDSVSLFRVLSMEILNISYLELIYLLNFAKKKNLSIFEALDFTEQTFLKKQSGEKLQNFKKMAIRHMEKSKKESAGQILYYFLIDSGLFETFNITDSVKDERRVQNIAKFFDRIKAFETERPDSNIFSVVEWLNLMLSMGDSPTAAETDIKDRNAVNILTVHSSKGLEFEAVFLVNLVSDRFPTRERSEKFLSRKIS
jgi:DNA helicase II / ATP-dependent DNA helicase PcrA